MASDPKARGKESPEPPEPPKPSKAPKLISESPPESMTAPDPISYYGKEECPRCQALAKLKLKPKADDSEYDWQKDEFKGDNELRLRAIHYWRKKWVTGGFYADCRPNFYSAGGMFAIQHFAQTPYHKARFDGSLEAAINKYNTETGDNLKYIRTVYAAMEPLCRSVYYITFQGTSDKYGFQTYQTVVSCGIGEHAIRVFRRKLNGGGEYEDLLPIEDTTYIELTKVKKDLMHTLEGHVVPGDPFYDDYKRICAEQGKTVKDTKSNEGGEDVDLEE